MLAGTPSFCARAGTRCGPSSTRTDCCITATPGSRSHPSSRRSPGCCSTVSERASPARCSPIPPRRRDAKVASAPEDPARAVARAVEAVGGRGRVDVLAHGTTVATNALLERRGARVALIGTRGFVDEIEIARQVRPSLYDPFIDRPRPLVPRDLRFEVSGRLDARGVEIEPFDGALPDLGDEIDAIAVCLLHSDLDPRLEREVADALRAARSELVVCSHEVSPAFREDEPMVTNVR